MPQQPLAPSRRPLPSHTGATARCSGPAPALPLRLPGAPHLRPRHPSAHGRLPAAPPAAWVPDPRALPDGSGTVPSPPKITARSPARHRPTPAPPALTHSPPVPDTLAGSFSRHLPGYIRPSPPPPPPPDPLFFSFSFSFPRGGAVPVSAETREASGLCLAPGAMKEAAASGRGRAGRCSQRDGEEDPGRRPGLASRPRGAAAGWSRLVFSNLNDSIP